MNIDDLIIEVTRRCNMKCKHCLRGNAQNLDIKDEYLDSLFSKLDYVSTIVITGGEPSLVPDRIDKIVEFAKKYDVDINSFYIVTNGKKVSDEFLISVIKLYCYCNDNEVSGLELSNDNYHEEISLENLWRLNAFKFFRNKFEEKRHYYRSVVNQGRARKIDYVEKREEDTTFSRTTTIDDLVYNETITSDVATYLNCKGNIVHGCDWSYRSQDQKKNIICKVEDLSIDVVREYLEKKCKKEE